MCRQSSAGQSSPSQSAPGAWRQHPATPGHYPTSAEENKGWIKDLLLKVLLSWRSFFAASILPHICIWFIHVELCNFTPAPWWGTWTHTHTPTHITKSLSIMCKKNNVLQFYSNVCDMEQEGQKWKYAMWESLFGVRRKNKKIQINSSA